MKNNIDCTNQHCETCPEYISCTVRFNCIAKEDCRLFNGIECTTDAGLCQAINGLLFTMKFFGTDEPI